MSTYDNSVDLIEDIRNLGITYIINQIESDYYIYNFGDGEKYLFFDYLDEYDDAEEKARDLRELADIYDHMGKVDIDIIADHIK